MDSSVHGLPGKRSASLGAFRVKMGLNFHTFTVADPYRTCTYHFISSVCEIRFPCDGGVFFFFL